MLKKKWARIVAATLLLLFGFCGALYFFGANSEPYAISEKFVRSSPLVEQQIGKVTSTRLSLWGFSIRTNGPDGHAKFHIVIEGEHANAEVFTELRRRLGTWTVTAARLRQADGQTVDLPS